MGSSAAEGGEETERGRRFVERKVRVLAESSVAANRGSLVTCWLAVEVDEGQFERLGKTDVTEFERGRRGAEGVTSVERTAEASVGRTLRGHERMFA